MNIEEGWVDLGFNTYALYFGNNYDVFICGIHKNRYNIPYFNCMCSELGINIVNIKIFSCDINIQNYIKNKIIEFLKECDDIKNVSQIFKHYDNIKINNNIVINNFIGGGCVI